MKVVFPRKGSIVLTKNDIETLEAFYNTNLITSKVYDIYNSSEFMVQVGNFNYLPKNTTVILDNANILTISQIRDILGISPTQKNISKTLVETKEDKTDNLLSDDDFLSHPFFQTLKPLN